MSGLGLRARIMIPVAVVLVAALVALAFFTTVAMRVELEQFVRARELVGPEPTIAREDAETMARALSSGGWPAVREAADAWQRSTGPNTGVVFLDAAGEPAAVVADWFGLEEVERVAEGSLRIEVERGGQRAVIMLPAAGVVLTADTGERLGEVVLIPRSESEPDDAAPRAVGRVNRTATVAMLGLALAALLLTWWAVTRALAPVEALRSGVQAVAAGDLARRVPTDRRDELGRLAAAFNSMAASLERGEELRRHMVADVAHELRTPLTALQCQLEALQDGLVEPSAERIDSLHEETVVLGRLVGDLQLLAEAEAGTLPMHLESLDAAVQVEQAIQAVRAGRSAGDGGFAMDVPAGLSVHADPVRLQQILRNLLSNAHEHGAPPFLVRALPEGTTIRFEIADSGAGIAADARDRIFERFVRIDPSRDRDTGGSGIGLTIVRRLVEAHGGLAGVESTAGRGATFWFTLPRADPD